MSEVQEDAASPARSDAEEWTLRLQVAGAVLIGASFVEALLISVGTILSTAAVTSRQPLLRPLDGTPRISGFFPLAVLMGLAPLLLVNAARERQMDPRHRAPVIKLAIVASGFFAACQLLRVLNVASPQFTGGLPEPPDAQVWSGRINAAAWLGDLAVSLVAIWLAVRKHVELASVRRGVHPRVEEQDVDSEPDDWTDEDAEGGRCESRPMRGAIASLVLGAALAGCCLLAASLVINGGRATLPSPVQSPALQPSLAVPHSPPPGPIRLPTPVG